MHRLAHNTEIFSREMETHTQNRQERGNTASDSPTAEECHESSLTRGGVEGVSLSPYATAAQEIEVYTKRWVILALYMGVALLNQLQYTTFSTIIDETKAYYDITSLEVNMLAAIFAAVYVVLVFPTIIFFERAGFRWGMILGALCNAICGCLKIITVWTNQYAILVVAQVFGGFCQVLLLALPPMLASLWFPVEERTVATAGGTLSGFIGISIAFFYAPLVLDQEATSGAFLKLWLSQAIPSVVLLILTVIFVSDHPPMPPSVTAKTANDNHMTFSMLGMCLLRQVKNFSLMRLLVGFGLSNGLLTALATVLTQITDPFGISETQTGIISSVGIFLGCINCVVVALIVDKKRVYKVPLIALFSTTLCGLALVAMVFYVVPNSNSAGMLAACYILFIIVMTSTLPGIPVTLEFAVEKTYPDPEMVASSFAMLLLNVVAVVGSLMYSAILTDNPEKSNSRTAVFVTIGVVAVSIAIILTVRQEHFRHGQEQTTQNGRSGSVGVAPPPPPSS